MTRYATDMRSYVKANDKKITALFKQAVKGVDKSCCDGMEKLLDAGVAYCLGAHDLKHHRHLEMGDSYGWLLLKDGREKRRRLFVEGGEARGNADRALDEVKGKITSGTSGYTGIVLAGMQPIHYFLVKFEFYAMRQGMNELTREDFQTYFQPIAV